MTVRRELLKATPREVEPERERPCLRSELPDGNAHLVWMLEVFFHLPQLLLLLRRSLGGGRNVLVELPTFSFSYFPTCPIPIFSVPDFSCLSSHIAGRNTNLVHRSPYRLVSPRPIPEQRVPTKSSSQKPPQPSHGLSSEALVSLSRPRRSVGPRARLGEPTPPYRFN